MTSFRTEININRAPFEIGYADGIVAMGSCFAENIGTKFSQARFNICCNPFGILYNPLSIACTIEDILNKRVFRENDLTFDGHLWHSFSHHGKFSSTNKTDTIGLINQATLEAADKLKTAKVLFVTLGTSWVYRLKETGKVAANCHKFPTSIFERIRVSPLQISTRFEPIINSLCQINPQLQIVFTVSPVRHWKDTAHGNQLSKSILLLAVDELQQKFENVSYFPAYELILDDLRDYRFFADDMLHPNNLAVDYVWEKLQYFCFGKDAVEYSRQTFSISKALAHKPLHPEATTYASFLKSLQKTIELIDKQFPKADITADKVLIEQKIKLLQTP